MDVLSAVVTLFLVMDPIGNVPLFLSALKTVDPARRRVVIARELAFAYGVLVLFLLVGDSLLRFLGLQAEAVGIAGGIVLFLIALRMIFPLHAPAGDTLQGEPFLVPLAIPLVAGPSTLATLLLLNSAAVSSPPGSLLLALTIAWALTGVILLSSPFFYRILGERGLIAMERLMGMLLVMVAVQMLLNGLRTSLK